MSPWFTSVTSISICEKSCCLPFCIVAVVASLNSQSVPRQDGASETWQKLLKLKTTASVMHVTAHPDDEHGGVLTKLSRGDGARLALLTLNRGESGDNAIGPQLFDALGLIRTEELLNADRHYGVDQQYHTTVVDYGFSKTLEESISKWGRETVLRDVVRIIRMNRPTIILSRFQGNERDGHGNHQTAGVMAVEGFRAAADPNRYPEQIAEGLRPWQAKKVYIGGVRENEDWTVRIDSGVYDPRLGDSYDNVARYGLSFQRSQTSGRFAPTAGPNYGFYSRMDVKGTKEKTIFDGVQTSIEATVGAAGKPIDDAVAKAMAAFTMTDPSAAVRPLAQGLQLTRAAIAGAKDEDAKFILAIKEQQFQDAINSAMGMELSAVAQPAGQPEPTGPAAAFAPPALMAAPVPGQTFEVRARLANRGGISDASGGESSCQGGGQGGDHDRRRSRLADRAWSGYGRSEPGAASAGDDASYGHACRRCGAQLEAILFPERAAGEPLHAERSDAIREARIHSAAARRRPVFHRWRAD